MTSSASRDHARESFIPACAVGRAKLVTRKLAGDVDGSGAQWYRGTRLYYDTREHLWLAIAERWHLDAGGNPTGCERTSAMEYRYDEGRARYMVRPRNAQSLAVDDTMAGAWHDYDGVDIYGDYAVSGTSQSPVATQTTAHAPGMAQYDAASLVTNYLHGNLIGTNEMMTGPAASVERRAAYTAFGERVCQSGTADSRYGYAGAWGYQEAKGTDPLLELGWLHVGERYYDPSSGRFMQRDPIGIEGELNTYEYVFSSPTDSVDIDGLKTFIVNDRVTRGNEVLIHYYEIKTFLHWKRYRYLRTVRIPVCGLGQGRSDGTEAAADDLIRKHTRAEADVVGRGNQEVNESKEVTQDQLKNAIKVAKRRPRL